MTSLFLCGDVMTGRGVDQIMRCPGDPVLYEGYMRTAVGYVELAESVGGPIPRAVDDRYVWGVALDEFETVQPDARIINLETAITARGEPWPEKGIHYRMHPENSGLLAAGGVSVASLANNHIMDWGRNGLLDTLDALRACDVTAVGAGTTDAEAWAPAQLDLPGGRRLAVFGVGLASSGIPSAWEADETTPGVALVPSLSRSVIAEVADRIGRLAGDFDVVVVSVHWGGNWGYGVPRGHRRLAHALIDSSGVDLVHGHSSHHPIGAEVHRGRLILYGCGDFINDYEGIRGHAEYRPRLGLMYFVRLAGDGELESLRMAPTLLQRFRVEHAGPTDAEWLATRLSEASEAFGTSVGIHDGSLVLRW